MKKYTKKVISRFENPQHVGFFAAEQEESRQVRAVTGKLQRESCTVALYWIVDENDGVIVDARFQAFGPPQLIAAVETACALLMRKNYDQARRISADLIDKQLQDKPGETAFPGSDAAMLNLVIDVIEQAAEKCSDIPFAETYATSPVALEAAEGSGYPGWEMLGVDQKIAVIEEIIAQDIRPYIELDAGGVKVLNLINDREIIIAYQGSCTTCYSATGSTLSAIQQILRAKIHPSLVVTPDLSFLSQSP